MVPSIASQLWQKVSLAFAGRRLRVEYWPISRLRIKLWNACGPPRAEKTHYLVVLGQNLSEDQPEELRKRAVDSGVPRDTYIKRVM